MHRKLRARIVEKYGSVSNFCRENGAKSSILSHKLCYRTNFSVTDIVFMVEKLDIPHEEIWDYFFAEKLENSKKE